MTFHGISLPATQFVLLLCFFQQPVRERLSNGKAEASQRDYDDRPSLIFRRKKADRGGCGQIPIACYLPKQGVCQ
jgi:hypothetical protein